MEVKVMLYTLLKEYGEGKIRKDGLLSIAENETLQGLSDYLGIPKRMGRVFLVNGKPKDAKHRLCNGDEVKILSFIGGG